MEATSEDMQRDMEMRLRGTIMGLLATSVLLSGCAPLDRAGILERQNNTRIMTLRRGMTPEQVIEHIGPSGYADIPNPFKSELFPTGDDTFRILYFYSQRQVDDGNVTDDELMPVVFRNGSLDGWGELYWEHTALSGRPTTPLIASGDLDDLPPSPVDAVSDISAAPVFTPFSVAPTILNLAEIQRTMARQYPAFLQSAGIGGTVTVYFFIDEEGIVQDYRVDQTSGHQAFDDAALAVADVFRFSAALNGDEQVPVWVSFPITFQVR